MNFDRAETLLRAILFAWSWATSGSLIATLVIAPLLAIGLILFIGPALAALAICVEALISLVGRLGARP